MPKSGWLLAPVPTLPRSVECPFLYQTRSILGLLRSQTRPIHTLNTPISGRPTSSFKPSTGDVEDVEPPSSFLKQKAAQVANPKPSLGPSITPAEKAAFNKIWKLSQKQSSLPPIAHLDSTNHTDADYRKILHLFSPVEVDASHGEFWQDATINTGRPLQDHDSAVKEYDDLLKNTTTPSISTLHSQPTDSVQSTTLKIVEDVATSLTAALTSNQTRQDIAMWRIAEQKIFPLIKLLTQPTTSLSSPVLADAQTEQTAESEQAASHHPLIPANVPLLPLITQTYPTLTLHLLRSYAAYAPTSPYALALLPTLKSLGPTSYVLGAHTHFYNTLLSLYWRIYSDLRAIHGLLSEMEANGVEFDVGTWGVLKVIGEDRERDMGVSSDEDSEEGEGRQGGRGQLWWRRHEQQVWWRRVGVEWREVVRKKLEDKDVFVGEVMREGESAG